MHTGAVWRHPGWVSSCFAAYARALRRAAG